LTWPDPDESISRAHPYSLLSLSPPAVVRLFTKFPPQTKFLVSSVFSSTASFSFGFLVFSFSFAPFPASPVWGYLLDLFLERYLEELAKIPLTPPLFSSRFIPFLFSSWLGFWNLPFFQSFQPLFEVPRRKIPSLFTYSFIPLRHSLEQHPTVLRLLEVKTRSNLRTSLS